MSIFFSCTKALCQQRTSSGNVAELISVDGLEELVQGLAVLLGSPELRAHMGTAARQTILGKLTLSHQAQYLATIYRQTIA